MMSMSSEHQLVLILESPKLGLTGIFERPLVESARGTCDYEMINARSAL
jgi:hypothetical protein